jgi:hypothetical protein
MGEGGHRHGRGGSAAESRGFVQRVGLAPVRAHEQERALPGGRGSRQRRRGRLASKTIGGGGDGDQRGGKTRRLPIQRRTDVAVPVDKAAENAPDFVCERIVPRFIESFNDASGAG